MELVPTTIAVGWASGLNAYGTALVLCLLGRAGVTDVPPELESNGVLIGSAVMYAIEFVTDKVPFLDSTWDLVHTAIRPAIGTLLGIEFADADNAAHVYAVAGGTGATALVSHGIKASLRLGINASPEPVTNFIASVFEDVTAGVLATLAVTHPTIAVSIVAVLLVVGLALVWFIHTRIRRAWRRYKEHRRVQKQGLDPPPPEP
jgi:hypothetical protein